MTADAARDAAWLCGSGAGPSGRDELFHVGGRARQGGRLNGGGEVRAHVVGSGVMCMPCCFIRMCLPSSRRLIIWSMSAGRLLGFVAMHSMTRFETAGGVRGFKSAGLSNLLSNRKLFSPFLFTV